MSKFICHGKVRFAQNNNSGSSQRKVGIFLLEFTWKIFCMTGNIDTYLLFKELENERKRLSSENESDNVFTEEYDSTVH